MDENMKVSIIVAIYNVENYLKKCLDTIINQTYKNLEIILVNDGSPDKSKEICEGYVKKDSRIILLNKKNGGLSDARNHGMTIATGKYILFLDSDDYIELNMIEKLVEKAEADKLDMVICGFYNEIVDKNENVISQEKIISNIKKIELIPSMMGYAWNKLYKLSFLKNKNLKFEKGLSLIEDIVFNSQVIDYRPLIGFLDEAFYHYISRPRLSLIKQYHENSFKLQKRGFLARKKVLIYVFQNIDEVKKIISESYVNSIRYCCSNMFFYKNNLSIYEKYRNIKIIVEDDYTKEEIKNYKAKNNSDKLIEFCLKNNVPLLLTMSYFLKSLIIKNKI